MSSRGRPLRSKLPAWAGGGGRVAAGGGAEEKDATNSWRLAGYLLIEGGGAKGGGTLGAGPAFIKGTIINCSRGWHLTSEDRKQLRGCGAAPCAVRAPRGPPPRGAPSTPTPRRAPRGADPPAGPRPGRGRPAQASSLRPAPRSQLFRAPGRRRGRGGRREPEGAPAPGLGTGAAGGEMLPKPVVSAAPAGPDPGQSGRGQEGDPGGSCSPVLPGPRHQPLKAVSLSLAALAGKGQVTSAKAGSREEPPAPPSSDPSSFVPSAASFPRGEGAAANPGGAGSERR